MDLYTVANYNISEDVDFNFLAALGLCFDHEMECDCLAGHS